MTGLPLAFAVLTAASLVALLIAERAESSLGIWISKPLASTAFIAIAVTGGALDSAYGAAIVGALVLSWFGDVFLIPKGRAWFLAGLVAFLLAHVAFVYAFWVRGSSLDLTWRAALAYALPAAAIGKWLIPKVPSRLRGPVVAYILVISAMQAFAVSAAVTQSVAAIFVGATAFYVSDLAVARNNFVKRGFNNKLWGLPLYYGAQIILASTAVTP